MQQQNDRRAGQRRGTGQTRPGRTLHRFSVRRKSTIMALSLLIAMGFLIATAYSAVTGLSQTARTDAASSQQAADTAKVRTLTLSGAAITALLAAVLIMVRLGPRMAQVESWIRRMGAGDLRHRVQPTGNDEITEMLEHLEVLRRQSSKAQQLELVQELSQDLQAKNEELQRVLDELEATQDQVISRQKLAELGAVTAGVAHELRNPLNLIKNFAVNSAAMMQELQEAAESMGSPEDGEAKEVVEELVGELTGNMRRIQEHSDRANRIIQDMLGMGRTRMGSYQKVQLNHLVEDHTMLAYHSARSQNPDQNVAIVRRLQPDAGEVSLIPADMGRVILNLVTNACHAAWERSASEPGHKPTIWIATWREDDWAEIKIRDNGPGIPSDIMGKIFNPFFTTKPAERGTGLGLSLSNDIVRQHGGSIKVESKPGEYAQFTIHIPAEPASPTALPEGENESERRPSRAEEATTAGGNSCQQGEEERIEQ